MKLEKITIDNKKFLGIKLKDDTPALRKTLNFKKSRGFLVHNGNIEEWYFNGIENSYIFMDTFEGKSLKDILTFPVKETLEYLIKLINALKILKKNIDCDFSLNTNFIYFLPDGSIIFFPQEIINAIINNIPEEYKTDFYLTNNSYLTNPVEKTNFSISTLIYKILSGEFPYPGKNEDEINQKIRNQDPISLEIIKPEIKKEIADFIDGVFKEENQKAISYDLWVAKIDKWIKNGLYNDSYKIKNNTDINKKRIKHEKKLKIKLFWEKQFKTVLILTIASITVFLIGFDYLLNILKPKSTKGFTAEKVVEHYYRSINKLDNISMSDAVYGNAGKGDIREVLGLFIKEKMIYANDNIRSVIPVDEWIKKGKPALKKDITAYGIYDLIIKKINDTPLFEAEYLKRQPYVIDKENNEKELAAKTLKIKDRLYLKERKGYWVIYKLERISEKKVND